MPSFEHYITVGTKRLRCGYTTGTCAAAAARAAAAWLSTGDLPQTVHIQVPAGMELELDVEEPTSGEGWAQCAVRKDAGDDPDATDGLLVFALVRWSDRPGVRIEGGEGVGRVTRPGLDQPVGEAAINSVPRSMICEQVEEAMRVAREGASGAADSLPQDAGLEVIISVPGGDEVAQRTFNPKLGIEGGISIIGTSGIVRPMSEDAIVESVRLEMRQRRAEGVEQLVLVPGNYGLEFSEELGFDAGAVVQCSNYIGAAVDFAVQLGFDSVLVVGHIGKMAKVAAGVMNTHSRVADGRMEAIAAHAALAGATRGAVTRIMAAATTDAALDVLDEAGLLQPAMQTLTQRVAENLRKRVGHDLPLEAVVFSRARGLLGWTPGAVAILSDKLDSPGIPGASSLAERNGYGTACPVVHFVGAGSGAVDLITVRGMELLRAADVVVYAGSLVNPALLDLCPAGCQVHDSAGLTLEEVVDILAAASDEGKQAVRLHTGEPSLYGAVREQMDELDARGIVYDVTPGVSAFGAAAASLKAEYTLPGVSQTLIISRQEGRTPVPQREQLRLLAAHGTSLALYLSAGMAEAVQAELLEGGLRADTPAAIVYKASWPDEKTVRCTVGTLAETASAHGIAKTALILVGDFLDGLRDRSRLYDPTFSHGFRVASHDKGAPHV